MALDTSTSGGAQQLTQNPQQSTGNLGDSGQTNYLQPGVASNQLNGGSTGTQLSQTGPLTVNFQSSSASSKGQVLPSPVAAHKYNQGLLLIPLFVLALAAIAFWRISRVAKKTTNNLK